MWWYMPLILALRRQRQVDLCKFKASLVYTGRPCLKTTTTTGLTQVLQILNSPLMAFQR